MGVGSTPAYPATHPRNTHDMTKEKAHHLANDCVNTLIDAGVLEEQRDFFALDLITERILVNTPAPVKHSKTTPVLLDKIELKKEIDKLRKENEALRKGNLNNLHAANDNA